MEKQKWHTIKITNVCRKLKTSSRGLSFISAERRLKKNGKNELPKEKPLARWKIFKNQLNNPLVYILLGVILVSFYLKHFSDSVFVLFVLLINVVVGFYQENKASRTLSELRRMVQIKVRVRREGNVKEIDSENLVIGDVVELKSGDKVAADFRLISQKNLKVNEASLTGEWKAVQKEVGTLKAETIISDRKNMLFAGTSIEMGEGEAVVVATGVETELGRIVGLVSETDSPETPLQKKISNLSRGLGFFILIMLAGVIGVGYWRGEPFEAIFMAALALAVSSIPEGLLPAITVILVFAMRRTLKNKGLIKRLSSAETLGSVTVVCTDKTGTLTEGKMSVSAVLSGESGLFDKEHRMVGGVGDLVNGTKTDIMALKIAALTNDAYIENPEDALDQWIVRGRYTDRALLLAGVRAGVDVAKIGREMPLLEKMNFDNRLKYAGALREVGSEKQLHVVGAPEVILDFCKSVHLKDEAKLLDVSRKNRLKKKMNDLTSQGLRVVACAYRKVDKEEGSKIEKLTENLIFVGFVALKDPLRKDVKKAMGEIRRAGIRPVIITGDHKLTAKAVAKELGFRIREASLIEGYQLDKMSDTVLRKRVREISVYARTLPQHKLRIIKALHHDKQVVAMFGDGVNDAPALKAADVGVAVGSGTDVAKETADVILLDDNFHTIISAIKQGRIAFANVRKVFIYLVADDFTEIFLFLGAIALGLPLPLLAVQILWINLIEDGFPDIALTTEQDDGRVMEDSPRDPDEPIINRKILRWMLTIFIINSVLTFGFFYWLYKTTGDIDWTRTMVFVLMAFDSLAFAYSVRSLNQTIFHRNIFSNKYLNGAVLISFVLLVLSVYLPVLQRFLGTQSIGFWGWAVIIVLTGVEVLVFEFFKKVFIIGSRRRQKIDK